MSAVPAPTPDSTPVDASGISAASYLRELAQERPIERKLLIAAADEIDRLRTEVVALRVEQTNIAAKWLEWRTRPDDAAGDLGFMDIEHDSEEAARAAAEAEGFVAYRRTIVWSEVDLT